MLIKTLTVGQLEENCYVVINEETLESWKHEHMRTPYHQDAAKV